MSGDGDGDNDELPVVEVIQAPPPRQRRPRTPNPAVDEIIQSGEIDTAARSMVIRSSQSQPVMQAFQEPPRVAASPAATPRRRIQIAWLVAALAPAAAVFALGLVKPAKAPPLQTDEAAAVAQLVGTTIDGEVRSAQVRAEAIASSSMLRAGILTDAATLADMAKDKDVAFPHKPTETIEVFQIADEHRTSLLRLPTDAPPTTPPAAGTQRIEQRGDSVIVVANAPVAATGAVTGEVVLVAPIDLSSIRARKYQHLTGVTLTGFPKDIPLGGGPAVADGATVVSPVAMTAVKAPSISVSALVAVPKEDTSTISVVRGLRIACLGLAAVFVLMFGVSLIRAGRA